VTALALTYALAAAEPPSVTATRLASAPTIDGKVVGDAAWAGVRSIEGFTVLGKGQPARGATQVLVGYDATALYVAFSCDLAPGAAIQAKPRGRDQDVYMDECVEIFLAPDAKDPGRYFHFIVNAAGSMQDELLKDPTWNIKWQAAATKREGGWDAEVAIPWAELPLPAGAMGEWRVNFARSSPGAGETSCWAPCDAAFHEPEHFGTMTGFDVDFTPIIRRTLLAEIDALAASEKAPSPGQGAISKRAAQSFTDATRSLVALRSRVPTEDAAALAKSEADLRDLRASFAAADRLAAGASMASAAAKISGSEDWAVCVEDSMRRIPAYEAYVGTPAREASVELARNEYEGVQIVVAALGRKLDDVAVNVGALKGPGGATLAADKLLLRCIAYVEVKKSTGRATMKPGLLPDPLPPYEPQAVAVGEILPLLLTVHAPADQRPGLYTSQVTISPGGQKPWALKLSVRVWDFALPTASALRTSFGLLPGYLPRYFDVWDGKSAPGWSLGKWIGPDVSGTPDYFGDADFDGGVTDQNPHGGKYCAWLSCTKMRKGSIEAPRAAYDVGLDLKPGKYTFRFAYRTEDDKTVADCGISTAGWTALPPTTEWREVKQDFDVAQAAKVYVYLRLLSVGKVYYDDVSLTDAAGAELAPNPGFDHVGRTQMEPLVRSFRLDMLAHRASDTNPAAPVVTVDGEKCSIDWTGFDRDIAEQVGLGLNAFNVNWCRVPGGWGTVSDLGSERERRISAELLRQSEAHLAAKGWLDLAYIYVIDEPGADAFGNVEKAFDFVHAAAPHIKRLLTYGYGATNPHEPGKPKYADLAGFVDIHVPHSDCFDETYLDARRKAGDEIWAYVCIAAQKPYLNDWAIDSPGAGPRALFWQLFHYRITGFLYWATTYWEKNPWTDPETYPGGNSDGSLVYPGVDGPVDSLRWETGRDGIEDYDYLTLARKWAGELKAKGKGALAARLEALCVTDDVTSGWTKYNEDPAVLMAHRHKLGEALSEAAKALGK
jgi:hypothetical protein